MFRANNVFLRKDSLRYFNSGYSRLHGRAIRFEKCSPRAIAAVEQSARGKVIVVRYFYLVR